MHNNGLLDWDSGKDMKKCARHIQRRIMIEAGIWGVIPRFQAAQSKLVPTQASILEGLSQGQFQEYI